MDDEQVSLHGNIGAEAKGDANAGRSDKGCGT